jgi:ATP-dependent DNA ligase
MTVNDLPVKPPLSPMLARAVPDIPGQGTAHGPLLYEPKWDGFRCVVFKDGDDVVLGSRNEKPLTRYFPEVVAQVRQQLPDRIVLDGEIVVVIGDRLEFERLLDRIHPADSRVQLLAEQTPASFVAFDLLALRDEDLSGRPQGERRALLEQALGGVRPPLHVTPATTDQAVAQRWFEQFEGAGLDGIVAKPTGLPYAPGKRVLFKVKHDRTADCVLAGFRWHKSGDVVGSLLLGLYDESGQLHHVGVSASFPMARRKELVDELAPLRMTSADDHPWSGWAQAGAHGGAQGEAQGEAETGAGQPTRMPGGQTRWNAGKDLSWVPLRPELVCEVAYDHLQGDRFRHTTQFRRWRPDRDPLSCTYEQLEQPVRFDLRQVLAGQPG